ncbi:hypothetical protein PG993_008097 [Apiospora rasikravindrae]|uniref:Uncharacterized protein n=1 Tax=Apiospora rasikravindrae TaxID=990691 RepID=A0ABR1SZD6_9PEZI
MESSNSHNRVPNLYRALSWEGMGWTDAQGRRFLAKSAARIIMRRFHAYFPDTSTQITEMAVCRLFNAATKNIDKCAEMPPAEFFEMLKNSVNWTANLSAYRNMPNVPASTVHQFFVACVIARSRVTSVLDNWRESVDAVECHPDWLKTSIMTTAIDNFKKAFHQKYPYNDDLTTQYGLSASYDSDHEGLDESDEEDFD